MGYKVYDVQETLARLGAKPTNPPGTSILLSPQLRKSILLERIAEGQVTASIGIGGRS
jgi:hypothetical protein